jgi:hypothetical protein
MKSLYVLLLLLINASLFACCTKQQEVNQAETQNTDSMKIKITVGQKIFTATLFNNPAATAFKSKLPLSIVMNELNGNEKYADLAASLPTNASNPGTIQNGDLMLYGSSTLVLFYKSFSTSYSYTRIGRVDDATGLAVALGSGNVTVKYELE